MDQHVSLYAKSPRELAIRKEPEEEIMSYINTFPLNRHKIFMLSRSYGLKNREIAEQLNISIKAVEKQISKALSWVERISYPKGLIPFVSVGCHLSFSLDSQRVERKFHAGE